MLILNDVHLGVNRQGGTTPASREALRTYLFRQFTAIIEGCSERHICILGDLFDSFEVEPRDWVQCYLVLQSFLALNERNQLTLVAGNHDHSPKAFRVSSFEMLCAVLKEQFGEQVKIVGIDVIAVIDPGVWALAHCSNQDIFDRLLADLLLSINAGNRVLLHANFNNNFAAQSDHSLNVSMTQAESFERKGATLYFAHEHQARTALGGSVVVFGNQWPTSISDCLNNDSKFAHVFNGGVTKVETWKASGNSNQIGYSEIDWRELGGPENVQIGGGFIKVTGTASANEAGDCMTAIAKFRVKSQAFIVSNGVHIEGVAANEDLPAAFEVSRAFDVLEFINSNLDEQQQAAVRALLDVQRG